jgi:hypothetical protein
MENLLERIRELKTKAKNRRDLERYEIAIKFLEEAIQILKSAFETASADWKPQFATELADCYGLLGGINRRWALSSLDPHERLERLKASFNAYDTGYQEYEAHEEYKIANSYNMLNRLISYLLLNPTSLDNMPLEHPVGKTLLMKKELEKAGECIRQQLMLERRGDIWALADLALVNLLLGRETPVASYKDFLAASPPDYAYDSALAVLKPLASLHLTVAAHLKEAVQLLEAKLQQLRGS